MQTIKMYTTRICPFCVQAKMLLQQLDLAFEDVDLTSNQELRMKLSQENNGWRTVPMIFIGVKFSSQDAGRCTLTFLKTKFFVPQMKT